MKKVTTRKQLTCCLGFQKIKVLAYSYYKIDKQSSALPYLKQLVSKSSEDISLVEMTALVAEKTGDIKTAIQMYEIYLSSKKSEKYQEYGYRLSVLYENMKQFNLAIDQYEKNIKLFPQDLRNYERLSQLYVNSKNFQDAIKILSEAAKITNASAKIRKNLADISHESTEPTPLPP